MEKPNMENISNIRADIFENEEEIYKAAEEIKKLENDQNAILRIGDKIPNMAVETTFGKMNLSDFEGKWLVFFSHPGDFTPD